MRLLIVSGNANVETVMRLDGPTLPSAGGLVPYAMNLNVSGVGVNLARGLARLGNPVRLLTALGDDPAGRLVRAELADTALTVFSAASTAQTLALVRPGGEHTFYRDGKGNHDLLAPQAAFQALLPGSAAALLTNIGWTRGLLPIARAAGIPIVTDVHNLAGLDHPYDQPYFEAADVLLLSAARLADPAAFVQALAGRTGANVIVAGLGEAGALRYERVVAGVYHQPAFAAEPVHLGGAGDALAAAVTHFMFNRGALPREALRLACAAAALKLRGAGSGEGHATEAEVRALAN